jgi:HEAT repeat protein
MLRSGIKEKSAGTRTQAVHALGLLPHDPEATEMVEAALKDPNQDVKVAAATALGEMGGFALDDWLQADAEVLRAQKQRKVKSAKAAK